MKKGSGIVRAKMDRVQRAKQFMPFAALKGYEEELQKQEKVVVPRAELSEDMLDLLDRKFHQIQKRDVVTVTWYHGGEYLKVTGMVAKIDIDQRILQIVHVQMKFSDIYDLEGPGILEN